VTRVALLLTMTGCSAYYAASGHAAAQGALDDLAGPDAGARYAAVAAEATRAARDELLGTETRADAIALVHAAGQRAQVEAAAVVGAAGEAAALHLSAVTRAEASELRQAVRLVIDEALNDRTLKEVAALREELAGAPLQANLNAAVDSAAPHLAAAITQALSGVAAPVRAAADAEAARWKPIAVAFAAGCGLLLLCLGFAAWLIRGHQQTIRALAARRP
jgi:hypothetical protein